MPIIMVINSGLKLVRLMVSPVRILKEGKTRSAINIEIMKANDTVTSVSPKNWNWIDFLSAPDDFLTPISFSLVVASAIVRLIKLRGLRGLFLPSLRRSL